MPDMNIEKKIQEALKRKSFKDNKLEYITLSLIFCLVLYVTFVVSYLVPFLAIFILLFVDIPLLMGFKHFIWFGPASGETLLDGFKVSLICGYLNFISYVKIFVTTNLRAFIAGFVTMLLGESIGGAIVVRLYGNQMIEIMNNASMDMVAKANEIMNINGLTNTLLLVEGISFIVAILVFYVFKVQRALLPYVSFLRLTNLEGKSMDAVIAHTKRVVAADRWRYYLVSTAYHLLYLVPVGLTILIYYFMIKNPVYSVTTVTLISSLGFFVGLFPALLFIELYYRKHCVEVNQLFHKERNVMLNDALNDVNRNSINKN